MFKSLLQPAVALVHEDYTLELQPELENLQKMFTITLVDKNANGIAFVCKKIAHKLTKRFIYGPHVNARGLYTQDKRPLSAVENNLYEYSRQRGIFTSNRQLPQFKIMMKMHKTK